MTITKTYGFQSKREAQTRKTVGTKIWHWDCNEDHQRQTPDSLLVVESTGPVQYNASGPTYWSKTVVLRPATAEEWRRGRLAEINYRLTMTPNLDWPEQVAKYRELQAEKEKLEAMA